LTGGNGFVRDFFRFFLFELGTQGAEAVEFLGSTAIQALGLGLVAQEQSPGVGLLGGAVESFAEGEIAILDAGDFGIKRDKTGQPEPRDISWGVSSVGNTELPQFRLTAFAPVINRVCNRPRPARRGFLLLDSIISNFRHKYNCGPSRWGSSGNHPLGVVVEPDSGWSGNLVEK
jgi:hypothetical protein